MSRLAQYIVGFASLKILCTLLDLQNQIRGSYDIAKLKKNIYKKFETMVGVDLNLYLTAKARRRKEKADVSLAKRCAQHLCSKKKYELLQLASL